MDFCAWGFGLDFHGDDNAHQKNGNANAGRGGDARELKPFFLVTMITVWRGLATDIVTAIIVIVLAISIETFSRAGLELASGCAAVSIKISADVLKNTTVLINLFVVKGVPVYHCDCAVQEYM